MKEEPESNYTLHVLNPLQPYNTIDRPFQDSLRKSNHKRALTE